MGENQFFRAKNLSVNTWRLGPDICSLICDYNLILWPGWSQEIFWAEVQLEKSFHSTVTPVFFWSQGQKLKRKHQKNNLVDSDVRQCLFKRKLSLERELSSIGFWIQSTLCIVHTVILSVWTLKESVLSDFAFQHCQGFIGIRNPRQKYFWNPMRDSWDNPIYPLGWALWRGLRHILDRFKHWHFHGPSSEIIWLKKIYKSHTGVKKYHFGNFPDRVGMAVPC